MKNLLYFIIFSTYSLCVYGTSSPTLLSSTAQNFATGTDTAGHTLIVWLDTPTQSYYYSYDDAGGAAISNGSISILLVSEKTSL